ncbi:phosphoenolpyruvate--protein phosphotransferase [Aphanothece hegewaldii CCALA 016]|uniref:Phosphocarrier protein HPr n=1 Tax=Aphanothece hegewaldii CCALA 016 TaxID=2107694 RepID=A0A2T1LUI8_9CHRO|nr:phosphoenolpyruvate--protein phosphotransferase [Aphanothece hegewaldii]PSF35202.1 phosphoenolpyruvate--protein phosphotransferase [Aphanothece hegewaldii CCALA 016]
MTQTAPISSKTAVTLIAPLSGYIYPIYQVPDPVFAQKMVGDGISIDPVSQSLLAPCDGEVIQLHPSHHAVTIRNPEGLEILMHIGLDTVKLRGEGFNPKVKEGDRVKKGDILIEFDADYLVLNAKSLITVIVIANSDQVARFLPRSGSVTAGRDAILELNLGDVQAETSNGKGITVTSDPIIILNPTGLHARPSAVLVNFAKKYKSKVTLKMGDKEVNARSVTGLMGLQVGNGATVHLVAEGEDAELAVKELTEAIRSGLGEEVSAPAPASIVQSPLSAPATPPPYPRSENPNIVLGASASPGVGVGYIYVVRQQEIKVTEKGGNPNEERRKLEKAINQATLEIEALRAKVHAQGDPSKAAIFAAHQELLEDPELIDVSTSAIDKGKSAAYAWQQAFTNQATILSQLDNQLLAERANDLRDVGTRVLRILTGVVEAETSYPDNAILVAEDLTPSDMANLDRTKVKGFCTVGGGATSHVSIMARSMGIPAIAGTEPRVLDLADGTPVILDGTKGKLKLNPASEEMERVTNLQRRIAAKREEDLTHTMEYALTQDGKRIEVVANIGSQKDAEEAVKLGAEGVGLLRTEFIFMERVKAPTEDEQTAIYSGIAKVLGPERPLIIRTLDVGGDKPISYMPIPKEENPYLGERGVRIGFDRPEILRTQIRAILRASEVGKVWVMFPMIGRLEEIHMVKNMIEEERQNLGVAPIKTGIMVEIPAAAVMADLYAKEVDFFSVGTNDLTQYTLAMDRGHPKLAPYVDGLHPAILRLIAQTVKGADKHGKWVGVCGGIGSDPQAIPILIGMGVKELSVSINSIPTIKAQIRTLNTADCQKMAELALSAETGAEVREVSPLPEI